MIKMSAELAALETETFEITEVADTDSMLASAELPFDGATATTCFCASPLSTGLAS
ncbi:hypothetical protein GCM10009555_046320 [Acrocarpospora macrocephala]|uniref:Uncharacterized protein n=1 Tax=Acrocarpospora macrocephala TaxID=150177 RepID=A0A5M3WRM2_9ACTN|nr:hypothetical protein [Acrocarpospora macrocephala]GES11975.1 hypothetical protein Amac_055720 [Acrocarpospora macrocephala]